MEINSVSFYVNDAVNTSNWFINCLGFQLVDICRRDNCLTIAISARERHDAIANSSILFIICSPLNNNSTIADYLAQYAEGIADITFKVDCVESILDRACNFNVPILQSVRQSQHIKYATVAGHGCLQHSLIESSDRAQSYLLPSGQLRHISVFNPHKSSSLNWTAIDHVVLNVAKNKLSLAVNYYQSLFNFKVQQTFNIATKKSGLYSQALIDDRSQVQFNINEPTTNNSQIQEFLDFNGGAGIQHLALRSNNLLQDVDIMRSFNVPFLAIPQHYYQILQNRVISDRISPSQLNLSEIAKQQILVDWKSDRPDSLLMQIFTKPILEKPTFFLEFIQRKQRARGFGEGNFKALFQAVERETISSHNII